MVWGKDVKQIGVRLDRTRLDKKITEKIFSVGHAIICKLENEEFEATRKMMQLMYDYDNGVFPISRAFYEKHAGICYNLA